AAPRAPPTGAPTPPFLPLVPLRSRLFALGALAALLPLSLACDDADPLPDRNDDPDPIADEPPPPVEVDDEALAETFGCDVAVVALDEEADGQFAGPAAPLALAAAVA